MGIVELIFLSIGLAMDAFAVSICKGLAMHKINLKKALIIGLWFGGFQAFMPMVGYFLGIQFADKIVKIDHWIAFGLLVLIGANMIKEALSQEEEKQSDSISIKIMFILAVATSIDALAVGVSFAFLSVNIWEAIAFIGTITLIISMLGVKIGSVFGTRYKSKAELAGGIILILLGIKILLEGLGVL